MTENTNHFTNINSFFSLLSEMKSNDKEDYENTCLISNDKLEINYIKLKCNHTFNYEQIFTEIKNQKQNYNGYEITKLSNDQIKCPYCRKVSHGILPWKTGFPKITFVNWPPKLAIYAKKCIYKFKSGKKIDKCCNKFIDYTTQYCNNHQKIIDKHKNKEKEKIQKLTESKNITDDKNISKMTVRELKQYCKNVGIKKYSKLRKTELLDLIEVHKKNIKNEIIIKISPINTNGVDKKKFKHLFEENAIVTI